MSIGALAIIAAFIAILFLRRCTNYRRKSPQDEPPHDGHEDDRYTSDKIVSGATNNGSLNSIQRAELETQGFHSPQVRHAVSSILPELDLNSDADRHALAAFHHSRAELQELESHPHTERRAPVTFSPTVAELPSAVLPISKTSKNMSQEPRNSNENMKTTQTDPLISSSSSSSNLDFLHTQLRRIDETPPAFRREATIE